MTTDGKPTKQSGAGLAGLKDIDDLGKDSDDDDEYADDQANQEDYEF